MGHTEDSDSSHTSLGTATVPADFTSIRLLSATLILALIIIIKDKSVLGNINQYGSHTGALSLFVYAAGFSYAYITLSTATGALILFAAVQFTMLFRGWLVGNKMGYQEYAGILLSLLGFIYFVFPELEKPSLVGCLLMVLAGISWGIYSLIGAKSTDPLYRGVCKWFNNLDGGDDLRDSYQWHSFPA